VQENKIIALLEAEHNAVASIVAGATLSSALEIIVHAAEAQADDAIVACILLLDEHDCFASLIAPTLPNAYGDVLLKSDIGLSSSPFGIAGFSGIPIFSGDIAQDQSWTNGRGSALSHGYRACWALPIFSAHGRILGVLGMLFVSPKHPTRTETTLLTVLVRASAHAIEHHSSEKNLADSEHQLRQLQQLHQRLHQQYQVQHRKQQQVQQEQQQQQVEQEAQQQAYRASQEGEARLHAQMPTFVTQGPAPLAATILIVTDDAPLQRTLQQMLRDFGYTALTACDGESALSIAGCGIGIDLLLFDIVLAGQISSLELGREAKGLLPDLKVLLMASSKASVAAHVAACETNLAPESQCLTHPFHPESLLGKVRVLLAEKLHSQH
jgi:CheY-like chemotaxis protein/GAF domain-containing protein